MSTIQSIKKTVRNTLATVTGLDPGQLYTGTVTSVDPVTKTCNVRVNGAKGTHVTNCVFVPGVLSGLLGIKTSYIPPVGTEVLLIPGPPACVVSCLPSDQPDLKFGDSRRLTGTGRKRSSTKTAKAVHGKLKHGHKLGATVGSELLEGELEITNLLGVGMTLLTSIARLEAGGKARLEACLLNDMIRIVSGLFKHHSAFGDIEIYNDGRLNFRVNGTSYEHEAWGVETETSEKAKENNGVVDLSSIDRLMHTGRWRYSEFIGFLGDMVHYMVTEPVQGLGRFAADAARAGKARLQMMSDGTVLMQSVTEIAIERVSRIVVPIEQKRWDDPTGNIKSEIAADLEQKYLKIWEYGKDARDIAKTCYQLREYARWLSGMHSYARFLQMDKDWSVQSESAAPYPSWTNREADVEKINPTKKGYMDAYSTIRIMRDGSIVLMDGYGNSVVASYNGLQLSSTKHIEMYGAGDVSIEAGQNLYMKARRNMEISATTGGIRIKARAWFHALCEWGTMWLKSDAKDPAKDTPPTPDNPDEDPSPIIMDRALILETTGGSTIVRSEQQLLLETRKVGQDSDIVLQAATGAPVRILSGKDILMSGGGSGGLHVQMNGAISLAGRQPMVAAVPSFFVSNALAVTPAGVQTKAVKCGSLTAVGNIAGPRRPAGEGPHENHIGTISSSEKGPDLTAPESSMPDNDPVVALSGGEEWDFEPPTSYVWGGRELFETLSEQRIRTDDAITSLYGDATSFSYRLKKAPRTGTRAPFPGDGTTRWVHSGGHDLHKPDDTNYADQKTSPTRFNLKSIVRKYLKLK